MGNRERFPGVQRDCPVDWVWTLNHHLMNVMEVVLHWVKIFYYDTLSWEQLGVHLLVATYITYTSDYTKQGRSKHTTKGSIAMVFAENN